MNEQSIIKFINELPNGNLLKYGTEDYRKQFIQSLLKVNDIYDKEKLKSLLSTTNNFTFNQGVSELLVWFLLANQGISFNIEQKKNCVDKKNVDVSFVYGGIEYNIEVKSPEYEIKKSNDKLVGRFAHRFGDRDENDKFMKDFNDLLREHLDDSPYKDVTTSNITDNKLKSCLLSAHDKFAPPTLQSCNILFVGLTTDEMINYWGYIINPCSGFFNPYSDVSSFLDDEKINIDKSRYGNVSAVILSNAIELNRKLNCDSWDLSKAINIVVPNPDCFSTNRDILTWLSPFFPHNTIDFYAGLCEFKKKYPDIPELSFMYEFVAKNGYGLNKKN